MKRASFQRKLYLAAGMLFLVLGALGVVIPVLPTTPSPAPTATATDDW